MMLLLLCLITVVGIYCSPILAENLCPASSAYFAQCASLLPYPDIFLNTSSSVGSVKPPSVPPVKCYSYGGKPPTMHFNEANVTLITTHECICTLLLDIYRCFAR